VSGVNVERVLGPVDVTQVQELTRRSFGALRELSPPSGALSESSETVAADFAEHGGLLLRDDAGRLLAACRVRRAGLVWVIRRCAVDPSAQRLGLGRLLVDAAHDWAREEGAVRTHVGVRDALRSSRAFWESVGFVPLVGQGFWTELVRPLPLVLVGPEATRALGEQLAGELRPGDLVVLNGPLGAGKTALTQGIGAGLGVRGSVTSPTFVLARIHPGPLPLVHVDAYRLRESGSSRLELDDLDLDASLEDSVTVVEWGEGLVEALADGHLRVEIDRPDEGETRTVRFVDVPGEQCRTDWARRLNAS
jgi:tRNA threonylcarbamoyladenosine biosynthesis protein TsaE